MMEPINPTDFEHTSPAMIAKMFIHLLWYIVGVAYIYTAGYYFFLSDNSFRIVLGLLAIAGWAFCNYKFLKD